jgi:hypothetical protein
LICRRKR